MRRALVTLFVVSVLFMQPAHAGLLSGAKGLAGKLGNTIHSGVSKAGGFIVDFCLLI